MNFNRFRFGKFNNEVACLVALDGNIISVYPLEAVLSLINKDDLKGHPSLDLPKELHGTQEVEPGQIRFIERSLVQPDYGLRDYEGNIMAKYCITFSYDVDRTFDIKSGQWHTREQIRFSRVTMRKLKQLMTEQEWQFMQVYCKFTYDARDYLVSLVEDDKPKPEPKPKPQSNPKMKAKDRRKRDRMRTMANG